jgi:hypothetical protein
MQLSQDPYAPSPEMLQTLMGGMGGVNTAGPGGFVPGNQLPGHFGGQGGMTLGQGAMTNLDMDMLNRILTMLNNQQGGGNAMAPSGRRFTIHPSMLNAISKMFGHGG